MEMEDIMWKHVYNQLQAQKSVDHVNTDHELRKMHLLSDKSYINGEWVSAASNKVFEVINPANGNIINTVPDMDVEDAQKAIEAAANAFETWKNTTAKERSTLLRKWYNLLVENQDSLAKIITAESGKPLAESIGEINYGNGFVEWFSEQARNVRGEIIESATPSKKILVEHHPIGVAALITPWNFPHAMITRKASPALAVGCTCIIKPAEDTPLTALALMKLAEEAGIPKGVLNVITSNRKNAPAIGKLLCESPLVAGISFTGSTQVGKILYKQCSQGVKRIGLELGGNAPFIVYNSADVKKAIVGAVTAKFRNCGQACVAANRFLVQEDIYNEFVNKLVDEVKSLKIGNGEDTGVKIGPLINQAQFHKISELVNDAISKGAKILTGGKPVTNLGKLFYEPTVIVDVKENMTMYHEEIFGPVVSIIKFKTEEESIKIANSTERGLAAYFFSQDLNQIFRVNRSLESGMIGVNDGLLSAVEAPFGGIKESGIGREGSHHGTEDYTYLKYTCIGNLGIQQVDGGFFEKFGSLFREQAEYVEAQEQIEKQKVAEAAAEVTPEKINEESDTEQPLPTVESDEVSVASTDSDGETEKDQTDLIATAWNIDELYCEVLFEILHNVGCDVSCEIGQTSLFSYAQDAFKISNDKHRLLMEEAEKKEAPDLMVNVEVIEAKDLRPKDSNGLSDPFVTLYLASNTAHRYNSSVKPMTLNPTWEEHFALPIRENTTEDTLCLEVWDFDPAESVKEKLGKVFDVKGLKGMRKLVKEIAVTATSGQHENELIGRAQIPLNTIPASGMTMWYSLDKKNKVARQGVLKVRVSFSSEKNNQVAEQEYRHLLRIVLLHELETSKVAPHWWCGTFSPQGDQLLTQHIAQSGLTPIEVSVCQYCVFAAIHQNHDLSLGLFSNLLEKIVRAIQTGGVCDEDVKLFWDATKKLLPSCFSVIRKIRKKNINEKTKMKQVTEVLKILNYVHTLDPPSNLDLFPIMLYPWISYRGEEPNSNIPATLNDAVSQGASDWLNHILDNNKRPDESDLARLQNLIQIIQLIRSDLQKAIEFYDKLFQETVNFQYAKALYVFYQAKLSTLCEPEVVEVCKGLKKLTYTGYDNEVDGVDPLSEGTSLFELYLAVQRFATLGVGLCPADCDTFHIKNFHEWFHGGVAQWLDIAVYKALQRIEKAVELDQLMHVDNTVKYSSSAVDTLTIFYQVKVFWQQLNWPDVESCYSFIAKIIDDICRCSVFYADKMAARVEGLGDRDNIYEKKFEVTNEWCLAINNIDYVRETLDPFTRDLGMSEVIQKISDLKSPVDAQRCEHTLENVIANAIDTVRNKIIELLETVVSKMAPSMKRLLIEGAELCEQDCNSVDRLMMYVDNNLSTLHRELNDENFNRTLSIVWDMLAETLEEIIQNNVDKRRPPSFFANLHKTLNLMLGSFKNPDDCDSCDALTRTEQTLRIHGLETADLIHEVHKNLSNHFKNTTDSPFGEISVRAKFQDTNLTVEVMNARNLIAMDSNGTCDSFVRIHLLPEHKFIGIDKPKTKTHNKTQFPLYDEQFSFTLNCDQRQIEDGLILFSVKDKDLLGYNNQYVGEAFLPFNDIEDTTQYITVLPQIHLQLDRPTDTHLASIEIRALEHRQGDKLAKEFLKKFRQRMGS